MIKKSALTANLVGGLDVSLDPTFLADTSSPNLAGVSFDKALIKKDTGRAAWGTPPTLNEYVMFFDTFPMRDGSIYYTVATTSNMYRYLANGTFSSILPANSNLTGNNTDKFVSTVTQLSNGMDIYIFTNNKDPIKKWIGGANSIANLGGLANVASTAKLVTTFKNHCILGATVEGNAAQPTRIRWSALGNPEEWEDTANGAGFVELIDSPDWITAFLLYKERLLIFKERSIWELIYVGGTTRFSPVRILDGVGTLGSDFPISLGDRIVFYGTDGIYFYDTYTLTPISDKIYPLLYYTDERIVNIEAIARARATYIEELGEYWLSVPTEGENPDTIFKVNLDKGIWTKRKQQITAFGFYSIAPAVSWWDQSGTWANQVGPWMGAKATSGAPTTLMGEANGALWEDNRLTPSSDTMQYETKDFMWAHAQRIVEIRVEAKYGPFKVFYSTNRGTTWSEPKNFAYSADFTEHVVYCNITTKSLRIKIESSADWCEIKWIEPWYIPRKRTTELSIS